jgi:hypothetical protein
MSNTITPATRGAGVIKCLMSIHRHKAHHAARGEEGHPFDDVIVEGQDRSGNSAVLEITRKIKNSPHFHAVGEAISARSDQYAYEPRSKLYVSLIRPRCQWRTSLIE